MPDSIYGSDYGVDIPDTSGTSPTGWGGNLGPDDSPIDYSNPASDPNTNPNTSTDVNSPFKRGDVFKNPLVTDLSSLGGIAKALFTDKDGNLNLQALGALGGGVLGAMGAGKPTSTPTGYQGGIPLLSATRNMITAPPTKAQGYRPGAGGINYGGDVTYSRLPAGTDPWVNLSGTSGTAAGANLTPIAAPVSAVTPGITSPVSTVATPPKSTGISSQQINDWLKQNAGASDITIGNAMDQYKVTPAQMAAATGLSLKEVQDRYNRSNAIEDWLKQHAGASDTTIRSAMDQYGVTPEQMALATGVSLGDVQKRYEAAAPVAATPSVSTADIQNWLGQHQGASDEIIAAAMAQYGVTPEQMAAATGLPVQEIIDRQHAVGYAEGGMAQGRYLQGGTDGMADKIPAQIGNDQPAALSHGEFVIPADVVSHLGNGNSDAGAKKLYSMMDNIRMARTGSKKQGKKINPDKFMPGGLANSKYAAGGSVKHFEIGGSTGAAANAGVTGTESALSNWAGPYVANMMGQGQALANMPFQQYMGPLTAGASDLQTKVFEGLGKTAFPTNLGGTFSSAGAYAPPALSDSSTPSGQVGNFNPDVGGTDIKSAQPAVPSGVASQYMNPYLQSVLQPQLEELRRQSQINLQPALGKLTQAGGLGGGRQAIMESEANRNLLQEQNKTVGQGYASAYDKAVQQFNTEQGQAKSLADLMAGQGNIQRGIESEGIAADKAQFEEARANPFKMVQFQQSLLSGLPLAAQNINTLQPSTLQQILSGAGGIAGLFPNTTSPTGAKVSYDDAVAALKKLGIG